MYVYIYICVYVTITTREREAMILRGGGLEWENWKEEKEGENNVIIF